MARYIRDLFTGEYKWVDDDIGGVVMRFGGENVAKRNITVIRDIEPFVSPIDGSVVSGRRQRRDHMRAHGVIEVGNEKLKVRTPDPLPPVEHDIRAAVEMVRSGYRPPRLYE